MAARASRGDDAGHDAVRWVPGWAPPQCRNCGSASGGRFCSSCGQSMALHSPIVGEFVHEFDTHKAALDGAL